MSKMSKRILSGLLLASLCLVLTACSSTGEQVVFYSNADDEAVEAIKITLDANGYEGQYIVQSFGTSELGGKLLAEGKNIEADVITMSSYYIESTQVEHSMFQTLDFEVNTLDSFPDYYAPFIGNQGSMFMNTEVMSENGLNVPSTIRALADPQYKDAISIVDIAGSSTAWLMVQALVSEYGEEETETILNDIYDNAGAHLESSGSGPIKKVRAGEVAIGFGLRHHAVADKADGLPLDYIDPIEGNFTLTESLAVIDKGEDSKAVAMEMVQCLIEHGRPELMKHYPVTLYVGEAADANAQAAYSKTFPLPLTVDLLKEHEAISENAKK